MEEEHNADEYQIASGLDRYLQILYTKTSTGYRFWGLAISDVESWAAYPLTFHWAQWKDFILKLIVWLYGINTGSLFSDQLQITNREYLQQIQYLQTTDDEWHTGEEKQWQGNNHEAHSEAIVQATVNEWNGWQWRRSMY